MRTYVKAAFTIAFLLAFTYFSGYRSFIGHAQDQPPNNISPNPQRSEFPTNVHLQCNECHGPGRPLPNLAGDQFHKDVHGAITSSSHGKAGTNSHPPVKCADCHTVGGDMTTIFPASDQRSTVNRANLPTTCGRCHESAARTFHMSIHGSRRDSGDPKPASCSDCHGSHNILPVKDPASTLNRVNAGAMCSQCHSSEVVDYQHSSHGMALAAGNAKAPVCTDCHTAVSHLAAPMSTRDFNLAMVTKCSECHAAQAPSYRDTFHGQATGLGYKLTATCADCHTSHRNLPASDPRSSINQANLVQTCAKCHANANPNFATYNPHPHPDDPEKSLLVYYVSHFMEWLLICVFGFFGVHTVLWLQRSIVAFFTEKREASPDDEQYVVRFAPVHRFTHVLIVVSFVLLAATGLPLMYYYTDWGKAIETIAGGVEITRFVHRVCAVITIFYALLHLFIVLKKAFVEKDFSILRGPNSMVPRWEDLVDLFRMVRWFLYLGPRPTLDRWTYWEKFDYFAVFWGVPVIGLSGLMLWFPTFFTTFLPGVVLNLAMIIHGEEALLATAFIFAFHFFHNHLRPENFPMDTVIFTGKMTLARFKEERAIEYERLVNEGKLDSILTEAPTRRARLFSTIFGFTAYILGLIMVVSIFWTLLTIK